ncbi:uncharacterized protein LOC132379929 [Hypanus sabinus]|uniref:uncharacterized protein LOC132379929 n=1 Tax=Hypanus sabinus TaxID=79690 RepID=UPI0028C3C87A|nr:uncharacterized protein LOC132379929 [Hypanus sabinus]
MLSLVNWFLKSIGYQSMKNRRKMMDSNPGNSGKHFVGLKNQGATCYLNTLLQTWFMTQEVKECITSYNGQDLLICQLRSLFERLSDGKEWSLSTEQLTSQLELNVYKQRDIEECFRSLVNVLSSKMDQEHNILKIYQVTMVNSLRCLKCTKSMDEDTVFLDIPLSVCSANAAKKFDSMEKSLKQFLKEERMEGDNKCYCNICEMKTETSSRYYFKHLPQILTFQLKRFEFDYNYMAFQKITDCITFPPDLKFTRSQDVHNEWCLKFTVNREVNAQKDSHVDDGKEDETPVQDQEVNREISVDIEGRNSVTRQDYLQHVSTGHEEVNAQKDSHVDDGKEDETLVQDQEVNREISVDIEGRNSVTRQDHLQHVSTGHEEVNAQKDSHVDDGKEDETPVQDQEVNREISVDIEGRNSVTRQDHLQHVSTGHEEVNAQKDSHVDDGKEDETPVQDQEVNREISVDIEGRNSVTRQDHLQHVSTGHEEVNAQKDSHVDDGKEDETPVQDQEVNREISVDIEGRNSVTRQDHLQHVSTGHEEVNAQKDSHVDDGKEDETPVQDQEVNREISVDIEGRNSVTRQDHLQHVSTGHEEVNAQKDSHVDDGKEDETPVQDQEVNREISMDIEGRNSVTRQDHLQHVSTGHEEVNAQKDSHVDDGKEDETPVQDQEVNREISVDIEGRNSVTRQDHLQHVSTGHEEVNAQKDSHVDDGKEDETPVQDQEVNREISVDIEGRNSVTRQDHLQHVSTGHEEVNAQKDSHVDDGKEDETPVQDQEVNREISVDIEGRNSVTRQDHLQHVSTGHEEVNAQKDSHVDDGKEDETPVQDQEVNREISVDIEGRNSVTRQDHPQHVSKGHEEVNAQKDSHVDDGKEHETPVQDQEVNREISVDIEGRNSVTRQEHPQHVSTGHEEVNAQKDSHVDDGKEDETLVQDQEVNREISVDIEGRNSVTRQDHPQHVSTGHEEVNAQKDSHVDDGKEDETPVQDQEVNREISVDIEGRNSVTRQDHLQHVSTGHEVNDAENYSHVDVAKDEQASLQSQEVNQEVDQQVLTAQEEKKYELFAIWHHRGHYGSGHYYAEIKSGSDDWYNFNDEDVIKENNFNPCSETAYVLMYRLIDAEPPAGGSKGTSGRVGNGKPSIQPHDGEAEAQQEVSEDIGSPIQGEDARPSRGRGSKHLSCRRGCEHPSSGRGRRRSSEEDVKAPWVLGKAKVPRVEGETGRHLAGQRS